VLLGGGQNIYKDNMLEEYRRFGYQIAKTSDDLKKVDTGKKVLGLFAGGHLPMTIDWLNHKSLQATVPTLAEMTAKALEMLGANDRFILQVEGPAWTMPAIPPMHRARSMITWLLTMRFRRLWITRRLIPRP
jgi:alkaline phosphatase